MAYTDITLDPEPVSISFNGQVTWKWAMELGMDGIVHVKSWIAFWELPQIPLVSDEGIPLRV